MPSDVMDLQGLSSSSFPSEELRFPNERQVGLWKTEGMPDHYGSEADGMLRTADSNSVASSLLASPLEKRMLVDSFVGKRFDIPPTQVASNQQVSLSLERHVMGAERANINYIRRPLDCDPGTISNSNTKPVSYLTEGQKANVTGPRYENGLFSSSLSELFGRKMRLSSNNALYGHSVGAAAAAFHYEEEEPLESLEEIEAQTIGNLLPNDDDLLSGVTDGLDCTARPSSGDDVEDLDFFSSVGGLELGEDAYSPGQINFDPSNGQLGGSSNALTGQPSRTLFVRNINGSVEDSELRTLFEQYGDIRTLYTACKHRGFVMISYYDLRAAQNALKSLQNKPLRCRKLDINFSFRKDNSTEKDINQGNLVVFNLDSPVSNDELHQIFGVYGEIKEIRETPHRSHHKIIEFFDVRDAEAALCALNKSDIAGKRIKLEPSRPGGTGHLIHSFPELEQDESSPYLQQSSPPSNLTTGFAGAASHGRIQSGILELHASTRAPVSPHIDNTFHHGISSSVPSKSSSLIRVESLDNQSNVTDSVHSSGQLTFELLNRPNFHPHSLPDHHDGLSNGNSFNSPGNMAAKFSARPYERIENQHFSRVISKGHSVELNGGIFGPSGNGISSALHYTWNNSPKPQGMMWPNSPSFVNGVCSPHPTQRLHAALPQAAPSQMLNTFLPINNHHHVHVGSAPSINPSLWDRRHAYAGESPDASSTFNPGSLGSMRNSGNSLNSLEFVSHNMFPGMDLPISSKALHSPQQNCVIFPGSRGQMYPPMMSPFDSPNERVRSRRSEGSSNLADNKKQFELDVDRIVRGEDKRTTLMIKNIPNKYTSKMLLAAIDERHRGTYDFIYLPIDFKNKCNVGYAFINMTDPSLIIPFYQAFNGKKWEKFNSEKVASLAYARIQGKAALVAHFQNSSLMNEDKRCRPILFHTDGPNAGDQVPFPMGVNIRSRPNKNRAGTSDENHLENPADLANGEESSNGDSFSGPSKGSE